MIMAVLTGFNYGGVLVVYVSSAARIWGNERVEQVYGYLFSANIPAAIAPILAGFAYDLFNGFTLALYIIAALMVAAAWSVGKNAPLLNTHENP
jgi:OFA family oxalate/formate antiporter-like MFS transporter